MMLEAIDAEGNVSRRLDYLLSRWEEQYAEEGMRNAGGTTLIPHIQQWKK